MYYVLFIVNLFVSPSSVVRVPDLKSGGQWFESTGDIYGNNNLVNIGAV